METHVMDNDYNTTYSPGDVRTDVEELPAGPSEWRGLASVLWTYFAPPIFCIGFVGNLMIIVIINRKKFRGTTTCVYLGSLALADLLVLIVGMFPEWLSAVDIIVFKEINAVTCKIDKFVSYTIGDVSIWILMVFTVDRCLAVRLPLKKAGLSTPRRAMYICLITVVTGVIKNFHVFWSRGPVYETTEEQGVTTRSLVKNCGRPEPFTHFETYIRPWIALTLITIIPFVLILVCNSLIIRTLITSHRLQRSLASSVSHQTSSERNLTQLTFMCLSASFAFLVFVTPSIILLIGKPYWSDSEAYRVTKAVNNQLFYINHSINFFLYCLTGQRFRHELWHLFCDCTPIKPPFVESDSTASHKLKLVKARSQSSSPYLSHHLPKPMYHSTPNILEEGVNFHKNGVNMTPRRLSDQFNTTYT